MWLKIFILTKWRNLLFKTHHQPSNARQTQTTLNYKTSSEWHLKWIHRTDKLLITNMSFTGNEQHTFKTTKRSLHMHPVSQNNTQPSSCNLGPSVLINWTNTWTYPPSSEFWSLLKNEDLTTILNHIWPDIKVNNQNKYQQKKLYFIMDLLEPYFG
jgi:hypothetical protein